MQTIIQLGTIGTMKQWGIKHQVLFLAVVPTIALSILLGVYFTSTRLQDLEQSFRERGEALALKLATTAEYGVYSKNKVGLHNLANFTLQEQEVQAVSFYNKKGEEILSVGKPHLPFTPLGPREAQRTRLLTKEGDQSVAFIVPVTAQPEMQTLSSHSAFKGEQIGWLKLELETQSIHMREYEVLIHTSLIFLLALGLSGLHAFHMGRKVTRPILELAVAVERVKEGDFNTRVASKSYQEFIILESGFNTMAQALHNAHSELQNKIDRATMNLRRTLETIEVQNHELDIARQNAEKANQIKSKFLADMSHEIRTPLNAIIGFIHILQKNLTDPKLQTYISTIQKSSNHLMLIINDILDFSKIEAKKLKLDPSPIDIRECVEEMDGYIDIECKPDNSAHFWFSYEEKSNKAPSSTVLPLLQDIRYPKLPFMMQVLAVDDNPENLKLINALLEDTSIQITTADNGLSAIEAFKQNNFDLIFMDIRMPKMDGIEATSIIRSLEKEAERKSVPIIAITAHALVSERDALLAAGINDYLIKPISEQDLKNMIHKWKPTKPKIAKIPLKTIDWDLGQTLAGGKRELAEELLNALVKSLENDKHKITEYFESNDFDPLRDEVHRLHGACCYCGVPHLKKCAQTLESSLASRRRSLNKITINYKALIEAIDEVLAEFDKP